MVLVLMMVALCDSSDSADGNDAVGHGDRGGGVEVWSSGDTGETLRNMAMVVMLMTMCLRLMMMNCNGCVADDHGDGDGYGDDGSASQR